MPAPCPCRHRVVLPIGIERCSTCDAPLVWHPDGTPSLRDPFSPGAPELEGDAVRTTARSVLGGAVMVSGIVMYTVIGVLVLGIVLTIVVVLLRFSGVGT